MIYFFIICAILILGILFLIFILYSVVNADDAIEDDKGNIIGYKPNNKIS
jgi:hypothetical protein